MTNPIQIQKPSDLQLPKDVSIVLVQPSVMGGLTSLVQERFSGTPLSCNIQNYITDTDRTFGMAFYKDTSCGYWCAEEEFNELESIYTYVSPNFRNIGIGRSLKLHQIAAAHQLGFHWLRGRVEIDNQPSLKMHQSLGIEGEVLGGWWHYLINVVESCRMFTGYNQREIGSGKKVLPSASVSAKRLFERRGLSRKRVLLPDSRELPNIPTK